MKRIAGLALDGSGSISERIKAGLTSIRSESQAALDQLARLHPPAEYEEAHTLVYAVFKLSRQATLQWSR